MTRSLNKALLPAGLRDVLPPNASHEAAVVDRLLACFASHGYGRVKPPLIEFEESLLSGAGAATASQTFRLMDPVSQRMMGLRADITVQVARIATTRLKGAPRPLRLSYAGEVLQVSGSQLRPERQFGQAGIELIGPAGPAADAEAVLLAAEALSAVGVEGLSIDLNAPSLVSALCAELKLGAEAAEDLRMALDRKDAAQVAAAGGDTARLLGALLAAAGPARRSLEALDKLDLPEKAAAEAGCLARVVDLVLAAAPELKLTIDPVESRGFEYHTGVGLTLFAPGVRGELGRGGRYRTDGQGEPATGFTLFMDTVMRALPEPEPGRALFLPWGTPADDGRRLRAEGWVTVSGLEEAGDPSAEARRIGCTHAYIAGAITPVE